jgi:hypothetical protein
MTTLLITGDRNWTDVESVRRVLGRLKPGDIVVHGAARGADSIAGSVARNLQLTEQRFPALWGAHERFGPVPCRCALANPTCRAAGVRRNQQMLDEASPDYVIFFHRDLANSRGTRDMVGRALKRGLRVFDGATCREMTAAQFRALAPRD